MKKTLMEIVLIRVESLKMKNSRCWIINMCEEEEEELKKEEGILKLTWKINLISSSPSFWSLLFWKATSLTHMLCRKKILSTYRVSLKNSISRHISNCSMDIHSMHSPSFSLTHSYKYNFECFNFIIKHFEDVFVNQCNRFS